MKLDKVSYCAVQNQDVWAFYCLWQLFWVLHYSNSVRLRVTEGWNLVGIWTLVSKVQPKVSQFLCHFTLQIGQCIGLLNLWLV